MIKILASSSAGNEYIITAGEGENQEILLLEAGIVYKSIKKGLNYKIDNVVGCLISHQHSDHSMSAKFLAKDGINIYAPTELIEKLQSEGINQRRIHIVADKDNFKIGNFRVKAFKNYHRNSDGTECECLGYLINHKEIGTILFATDTYLIKPVFSNVQNILVECNYNSELEEETREDHDTRRLESHMSLNNLKTFIQRWNLEATKDITLIHLSQHRADEDLMKKEIEELTGKKVFIAKKGLIIE